LQLHCNIRYYLVRGVLYVLETPPPFPPGDREYQPIIFEGKNMKEGKRKKRTVSKKKEKRQKIKGKLK
jgi:hypothetical protein